MKKDEENGRKQIRSNGKVMRDIEEQQEQKKKLV